MGLFSSNSSASERDWWRQAVVYQIYPRSFADANGDGIGDFRGVTSRVAYLKALGIDAIWFSPFYPSALKDGGYDVADYRNVDPRIGTLEDFDEMSKALEKAGIRIIVDIVPNHCSDDHEWFQAAVKAGKGSKERELFHFYEGKGEKKDQPPQDWICAFGGPAWSPSGANDGEWYLHSFDPSQPDLNWDHPTIRADFLKTLRFWSDRGVSGFRIDVANMCVKDMKTAMQCDQAKLEQLEKEHQVIGSKTVHPLRDLDGVLDVYREWRTEVFNKYNPPRTAVAEAWVRRDRFHLYADPNGLGQCFSFDALKRNFSAQEYKEAIDSQYSQVKGTQSSMTWVLSNHDVVRHASRFGLPNGAKGGDWREVTDEWLRTGAKSPVCDVEQGLRRARAAIMMLFALPGSTYIYQGEELGLPEVVDIPAEKRQDPTFFRTKGERVGRDGCRVPIPWTPLGPNFGYSDDPEREAHLPQPKWLGQYAISTQDKDTESTLHLYRRALALRKKLQAPEEMEWINGAGVDASGQEVHGKKGGKDIMWFKRPNGWECLVNCGKSKVALPEGFQVVLASGPIEKDSVPGETAVWLMPK